MKGEGTQIVATDTEDRKEESGDKDGTRERHKKTHTSSKHNESAELPHNHRMPLQLIVSHKCGFSPRAGMSTPPRRSRCPLAQAPIYFIKFISKSAGARKF